MKQKMLPCIKSSILKMGYPGYSFKGWEPMN